MPNVADMDRRTKNQCWDRAWAIAARAHLNACHDAHRGTNQNSRPGNATTPANTSARNARWSPGAQPGNSSTKP